MSDTKLLEKLREVYGSYYKLFELNRNQVHLLLGKNQNSWSGLYREGLIKDILRRVLPEGIGINSGFIYGYDEIQNSNQLDIIIWDSFRHSAVFKTNDFVIVSPESVISVISSKTRKSELKKGLDNLSSIIPLDYTYKLKYRKTYPDNEETRPISKYLIFFKGVNEDCKDTDNLLKHTSKYFRDLFKANNFINYLNNISLILDQEILIENKNLNSSDNFIEITKNRDELKRYFPRMILDADDINMSFYFGMGENPNKDSKFKWIPNVYKQGSSITTPFEKFIFYLLQDIYKVLKIQGVPMLCGWSDISPEKGYRGDDISELVESSGLPTIEI